MAGEKEQTFGGPVVLLNRDDINTDEIIPAKYLTEISKEALGPHLLEDLELNGFDSHGEEFKQAKVLVTRSNFGCGSSREHAVWALEVNDINVVIASSFARIFRQNMFNCGILAIELNEDDIEAIFAMSGDITIAVDMKKETVTASSTDPAQEDLTCEFSLNAYDHTLVNAGGWLAYAEANY
jgi:3-isopropylmalate/(R)-2-methylmalate dehydratase small subunit